MSLSWLVEAVEAVSPKPRTPKPRPEPRTMYDVLALRFEEDFKPRDVPNVIIRR